MIALVDYGAGNLTSVRKALTALGVEFMIPAAPGDVHRTRGIIVPGVGHFDRIRALDADWRHAIADALDRGAGLLGICLGMQWLFEGSAEAPDVPGFGLFEGRCARLDANPETSKPGNPTPPERQNPGTPELREKIPHVGWNSLTIPRPTSLMAGISEDTQVYFTHSYAAPATAHAAAITTYIAPFTSAVECGRIAGVQFHPEKSGEVGLRILGNWLASL